MKQFMFFNYDRYYCPKSGQFDWMLKKLLDIYENHPPEDVAITALAVFGLLKASAILKCVSDQT